MKNYIVLLGILSLILSLGIVFSGTVIFPDSVDIITWTLLVYFLFVTFTFHLGLLHASKGRPQVFVRYYMASTTFKLMLHMGVILIYSLFNKTDAVRFITTFLIFYVIFTTFEVGAAWKQFRAG